MVSKFATLKIAQLIGAINFSQILRPSAAFLIADVPPRPYKIPTIVKPRERKVAVEAATEFSLQVGKIQAALLWLLRPSEDIVERPLVPVIQAMRVRRGHKTIKVVHSHANDG